MVAHDYIVRLFASSHGTYDPVIDVVEPRVSNKVNNQLVMPFTKVEFQNALFQMHPDKTLRPNGINPAFYQTFWEVGGGDDFSSGVQWLEQGFFSFGY